MAAHCRTEGKLRPAQFVWTVENYSCQKWHHTGGKEKVVFFVYNWILIVFHLTISKTPHKTTVITIAFMVADKQQAGQLWKLCRMLNSCFVWELVMHTTCTTQNNAKNRSKIWASNLGHSPDQIIWLEFQSSFLHIMFFVLLENVKEKIFTCGVCGDVCVLLGRQLWIRNVSALLSPSVWFYPPSLPSYIYFSFVLPLAHLRRHLVTMTTRDGNGKMRLALSRLLVHGQWTYPSRRI